jgi:hypothetical protein
VATLSSIRSTINFLFDFYEKLFFWIYVKCTQFVKIFITRNFSRTITWCNTPASPVVSCLIVKSFKNCHLTWDGLLWWEWGFLLQGWGGIVDHWKFDGSISLSHDWSPLHMRRPFFGIFDAWTCYKTRGLPGRGCTRVSRHHHQILYTKSHIRSIQTNFQCLSVSKTVLKLVLRFSQNWFFMQSAQLCSV